MQDPEVSQEFRGHILGKITKDQAVGQSFVLRRRGFDGIWVWMQLVKDEKAGQGVLLCKVYKNQGETSPLSVVHIPYLEIDKQFPINIKFPLQVDSQYSNYYVEFTTSDGEISILGRLEDAYPKGQAFINRKPIEADIGFRTSYNYDLRSLWVDIIRFSSIIIHFIKIWLVIWLPGYILYEILKFFDPSKLTYTFDKGQRFAIQIGLSLAIIPVVYLWLGVFGIEVDKSTTFLLYFFLLLCLFLVLISKIIKYIHTNRLKIPNFDFPFLLLAFIFILTLGVRLIMVRDLAAPAWVDSVHHAVITRLIIEGEGLPSSYSPYINTLSAGYHPGFHTTLAIFHLLTDMDIPEAMLLFGQFLNAACVISVYLFTKTLLKNQAASLFAALITGFITPMPAYYTSWGRYTQLSGMVILPAAITLVITLYESNFSSPQIRISPKQFKKNISMILMGVLLFGGLLLTHYRVAAFLVCFFIAFLIVLLINPYFQKSSLTNKRNFFLILIFPIFFGFLLTAPWWEHTFSTLIKPSLAYIPQNNSLFYDFDWQYLTAALGNISLILAGIGLITAIYDRMNFSLLLMIWILLLFILANLRTVNIPGSSYLNNTSVEIFLFLPISAFCGYLVIFLQNIWSKFTHYEIHFRFNSLLVISGSLLILFGSRQIIPLINPGTILFREVDKPALIWIEKNIPPDEPILINSFYWGYGLYAGTDGGFWITPISARISIPPPVLFGLRADPLESKRIPNISRTVNEIANDPEKLYNYMVNRNINHIYIGSKGGPLSPKVLKNDPNFRILYKQENTWVFKINTSGKINSHE